MILAVCIFQFFFFLGGGGGLNCHGVFHHRKGDEGPFDEVHVNVGELF